MDSKSSGHLPALDGVRGVAILLVIAHQLSPLDHPTSFVGKIVSRGFGAGWMGVQLFFVLSGFLITGILLDTQSAPNQLRSFFARRVLRIFPLYYATLLVGFVVLPLLGRGGPALAHNRAHQVWLWTYLSNWVVMTDAGSKAFSHFWSLAVEEQFYLLWPFVARPLAAVLSTSASGSQGRRCLRSGGWRAGMSSDAIYHFTITRMDALALGAAAAAAVRMPALAALARAWRGRLWARAPSWACSGHC